MPPPRPRFFPGEGVALDDLRQRIDDYLQWLRHEAAGVPGCRAFLLGGGYGRGEGGILQNSAHDFPRLYNDLEFYLFSDAAPAGGFQAWAEEGERRLHLEIEFKAIAPEVFARARPSMFYYDLLCGHVAVVEDQAWLNSLPASLGHAEMIPPVEGSRLLINRAISLPRCFRSLAGRESVPEGFFDRILQKCQLALGDAVLCAAGRYHWSCVERSRRLPSMVDAPPVWGEVLDCHAEAVEFKFHPWLSQRSAADWQGTFQTLSTLWTQVFLWLESRRLGLPKCSVADYAQLEPSLFPEETWWKNGLRQLRDRVRGKSVAVAWGRHPREVVWRTLPLLLSIWTSSASPTAGAVLAAKLLGTGATNLDELSILCRELWQRYP